MMVIPLQLQGLTVLAGSWCPSSQCIRLATIRNKKVKPLSLLEGVTSQATSSCQHGEHVVSCHEDGNIVLWSQSDDNSNQLKITTAKKSKRENPY